MAKCVWAIIAMKYERANGRRLQHRGFTLLEVLVAVSVVAIALSAVMTEVSRDLSNTVKLRNKTLAQWVAMNKVTEWQLSAEWPKPGVRQGEVEMARQNWYWTIRVSTTDDENVRRLDVAVSTQRNAEQPRATVLAYLGKPIK